MKKAMRTLLLLLLALATFNPAYTQSLFIPREINCPGGETAAKYTELADIDNDGDLDLIGWALSQQNALLVYQNQGGTLDIQPFVVPLPELGNVNNPIFISQYFSLYDWNQDGLLDLFRRTNYKLYCQENLGGLAFGPAVQIGPDNLLLQSRGVEIRDFNGDLLPDLAVPTTNGGGVRFVDHSGTELAVVTFFSYPQSLGELLYTDFDGDGLLDIILSRRVVSGLADLLLYRNTGGLQFQLADTIASNLYVSDIQIVDMDGVAPAEIMYLRNSSDSLFYSKWDPNGQQFIARYIGFIQTINNFLQFRANILSSDLNGDGLMDVVADNVAFFQKPNGTFIKVQAIPDPQSAENTVLGDTDGDGLDEIWFRGAWINDPPSVFRVEYAGNNTFQPLETMWVMYSASSSHVRVFDADNDGQLDVFYQAYEGPFVLSRNNNGTFTEMYPSAINASLIDVKVEDLDADGLKDILFINYATGQTVPHYWTKNLGSGNFQFMGQVVFTGIPTNPLVHGLKDLDNDGLPDIFSLWRSGDLIRWSSFKNTGNGTYALVDGDDMESYFAYNGVEVDFHDVDNDGYQDVILFYKSGSNQVRILHNDGGTGFTEIQKQMIGSGNINTWYGLADVTNDGNKDIVYAYAVNSILIPKVVNYLEADGNGTFFPPAKLADLTVDPIRDFFLQDINNDGLDDLISQNYGFQIALNTGTGFGPLQQQVGNYTINQSTPMADFDGDGDLDAFGMAYGYKMTLWENLSVSSYRVVGLIFFDVNGNGIQDPGEPPFPGAKVGIDTLSAYALSDSSGRFNLPLGSNGGVFQLRSQSDLNPYLVFTTPYPALADISTGHPSDTVSIGVQVQGGLQSQVEQTLGSTRCGQQTRHWVSFKSIAPVTVAGELMLQVPAGIQVLDIDSLPGVVIQGREIRWLFDSLPALGVFGVWADVRIPLSGMPGDILPFFAELRTWAGGDTSVTHDTLNPSRLCSFDPNDKQITNSERFMEGDHLFTVTDEVEYTVRFQNTGNDTAFQVVIRDILPTEFDPASVQFLAASHDYWATSDAHGGLVIHFPGILLPDSTANFTGSMGYVKFRVNLKTAAPQAKDIQNGARIYFDQNPPVYTNIVSFQRVDCRHFTQIEANLQIICANAENTIPLPNFGVSQQYQWFWDGVLVSTEDTARFFIPTDGQHLLRLAVTNKLCQADTVAALNLFNSLPDLALNITSDTTICTGITLSSPVYCSWSDGVTSIYSQDFQVVSIGLNNIRVASGVGSCIARDTILVEYLNPGEWEPIYQNQDIHYVCPGEELQLFSIFSHNIVWTVYPPDGQLLEYSGNPLQFSTDTLQGTYFVILSIDTLNCTVNDYTDVTFVARPVILQQPASLATKSGQAASWFYAASLAVPFDSIAYGSLLSNPANGYYFIREITGTCEPHSDTIHLQITNLTETTFGDPLRAWFDFRNAALHVEGNLDPEARFRVFDLTGRCVLENRLRQKQRLEILQNGMYLILVHNGNQVKTLKAIVQRL